MTIKLLFTDVDEPQNLFVPYQNHDGDLELLIVYSGVMRIKFFIGEDETRDEIWSWVPYPSLGGIQDFKAVNPQAVASGSLSVWTHPEDNMLAALDKLVPEFRRQPSLAAPGTPFNDQPIALVLKASVGAFNCRLLAIPFKVTVRVRPKTNSAADLNAVRMMVDPAGFERVDLVPLSNPVPD